jgi:hypothetical protein
MVEEFKASSWYRMIPIPEVGTGPFSFDVVSDSNVQQRRIMEALIHDPVTKELPGRRTYPASNPRELPAIVLELLLKQKLCPLLSARGLTIPTIGSGNQLVSEEFHLNQGLMTFTM